jgi:hypothetical protein
MLHFFSPGVGLFYSLSGFSFDDDHRNLQLTGGGGWSRGAGKITCKFEESDETQEEPPTLVVNGKSSGNNRLKTCEHFQTQ